MVGDKVKDKVDKKEKLELLLEPFGCNTKTRASALFNRSGVEGNGGLDL